MAITRREFIKIGAAATGAAAVGTGLFNHAWAGAPGGAHDPGTEGDRVVATFCEMCFWKCGVLAHVKDGRVTKLEGNPEHPLSRGRLCPRGTGGMGLLYDPDRLKKPLMRVGERGNQRFEEVSWEKALDFVAGKLAEIKEKHGPEAVALYSHGFGGSFFKHLLNAYGSSNVAAPSYAQCRGARDVGFQLTYGSPVGSPERTDLENARVITLIGSHLGENMHNTQVQELATALDRGADLIVVDPRYSVAAGKARHWLPIKPGTDIALLLAWMHVIVREGLYDRDYVAQYTVGFEALEKHLQDKTPEWAFARTSIPAATIEETARLIAGARPASLVHPGRHTAWYGDDTQRSRAIAMLNGLLGSWGHRGGFFHPGKVPVPDCSLIPPYRHEAKAAPVLKGDYHPFVDEVLAHGLCDATIPGTADYDLKAWIVYGTNLIQALPQPERTIKAIQELELMVVVDVLPAEITGWADVVLPEATYLERWDDLAVTAWRDPFVAVRQEVVPPLYDSKPGWWIARELGHRLGLGEYFPCADAKEIVVTRLRDAGIDVEKTLRTGVHLGKRSPVNIEEGLLPSFGTPSGKVELYSQQLADAGLDPLPEYTAPEEPGPGQFRLLFGRAPSHTFGRTTNNRFLSRVYDENELWLNAKMAREMGLRNGERVTMVNQDGVRSQPIRLKVTQRIRPDCVYMVHGFGHTDPRLRFAHERGADDQRMVTKVKIDPAMGGTGMSVNFVSIEKAVAA